MIKRIVLFPFLFTWLITTIFFFALYVRLYTKKEQLECKKKICVALNELLEQDWVRDIQPIPEAFS